MSLSEAGQIVGTSLAVICVVIVSLCIVVEAVKAWRLSIIAARFQSSACPIRPAYLAPACLGPAASVFAYFFRSEGREMVANRLKLSNRATTYISHARSFSSCIQCLLGAPIYCMLLTSDPDIAIAIMSNLTSWIKIRSAQIGCPFSYACTDMVGDDHSRMRSIISRALRESKGSQQPHIAIASSSIITTMQTVIDTKTDIDQGRDVNLLPAVSQSVLALMIAIVFGSQSPATDHLYTAFLPYWVALRTTDKLELESSRALMQMHTNRLSALTALTRSSLETLIKTRRDLSSSQYKGDDDCLADRVMADGGLSEEELLHNLHNLLRASFETIVDSFLAAIIFLADYPERQRKIITEGRAYSKMVWKETLRLLPPVMQVDRISVQQSQAASIRCPVNTYLIVDFISLHQSSHWGADAAEFRPERWESLDDDVKKRWMPFGVGPKSLAAQIVETLLIDFVKAFEVSSSRGFEPRPVQTPVLRFKGGVRVRLRRRDS